jgi:thiol:disulfide interchange protein DsbG
MKILNARRRSLSLVLPLLAALALSACNDAPSTSAQAERTFGIPSSQPVTAEAVRASARGFTVGQQMSKREVFVFFDPKCPHCAMFWLQSVPLKNRLKFTWVPVAWMGKESANEGAALLGAEDKVDAMNKHAAQVVVAMRTNTRIPSNAKQGEPGQLADIARNSRLLASFGGDAVPYVVAVDEAGKVVLNRSGVMPDQVAAALSGTAP